jgi:hypothetical protein
MELTKTFREFCVTDTSSQMQVVMNSCSYRSLIGGRARRGKNGVFAMRDGGDMENRVRLGQGAVARVVTERAFVAERLARVHVAFDGPNCVLGSER